METVRVRVGDGGYPVLIEAGGLNTAGRLIRERLECGNVVVVADARVSKLYRRRIMRSFREAGLGSRGWITVSPGERSKNLTRARSLYQELVAARVDRWTPVVALGGGVVGDLAGFAASTFMRGLPLVQIPTTVVAQVDSSVGGKTAVNFGGAKNLVGSFHQPRLVLADPETLRTLPPRDYRAGLAEAVKIGVTLRPDLMELLERETEAVVARDPEVMTRVVASCVAAKGEVVGRDEREQDVRAVLNYGHTVGHALEAESLGRLRHGEAVAVGMHAAAWLGEELGVTLPEVLLRQNDLLRKVGLKIRAQGADKRVVSRNLMLDKKVRERKIRFVLTLQIGGASVWPQVSGRLLRDAVRLVTS